MFPATASTGLWKFLSLLMTEAASSVCSLRGEISADDDRIEGRFRPQNFLKPIVLIRGHQ